MTEILKKIKSVTIHVMKTLRTKDAMDILGKMISDERDELIDWFMHEFIKFTPQKLSMVNFKEFLQKVRQHIHMYYARFINIDDFINLISKNTCTNVISLMDCCREIKTKGATKSIEEEAVIERIEKQGIVDKEKT
jgi:hypothetical protein